MSLFSDDDMPLDLNPEGMIQSRGHHELHMRRRIPVAVLGATGAVGQRMVEILDRHPWFEIVQLAASHRSDGKKYKDAVHWLLPTPISKKISEMKISSPIPQAGIALAFSALDSSVAEEIETQYADFGIHVVTNAKSHRMKDQVPLLIPEVNMGHLTLLDGQKKGAIVANPNCAAIGLCIALKPLISEFGIDKVHVTTYQSTSGAGFPGVSSLSILDNIIPYIPEEEEKVEKEPLKIFSKLENGVLIPPELKISAACARVPVTEGHLESVSVSFKTKPKNLEAVAAAFQEFRPPVTDLQLPSAPLLPIHYFSEREYPQPKLHRMIENGMAVSVGALRQCPIFDAKFFLLSHNTIRGAAGGSILIGELLVKQGRVFW